MSGEEALSADEALNAAVVRVGGVTGTVVGGGFLVTADRVLTCAHVVSDALGRDRALPVAPGEEVLVDFPLADGAGERVVAEVEQWIREDPPQCGDVAVLRLGGAVPGTRPLPIAASDEVSDRPVRVVGFPDDELGVLWHRGELSGKSAGDWIQLSRADSRTAHITAGYSGSPVWDDRRGAAVGIVVASQRKRDDAQQSFAISVKAALAKLPDLDRELAGDPFLGIDTFQEGDEEIFFGRDAEIGEVVAELEKPRAVTLFGPSGCGKSSLARAGVVPRMRRGSGEDESDHRPAYDVVVVDAGAGGSLLSRLAAGLYEAVRTGRYGDRHAESVDQVREWLADKGLVKTLNMLRRAGDGRCLVVLDQAEALLELGDEEFDADAGLLFPKDGPKARCPLIVTLRSDFMDAALRHPRLGPLVSGTELMPLMPMSEDQLRDVITKPVEKAPAVVYEPGLADRILADAYREPENLPLLGFLLKRLWDERFAGRLRLSTYTALHGVEGALQEHCEKAWKRYGESEPVAAARLLRGLVRVLPGSGTPLRRRLTRKAAGPEAWELARAFASQRLIVLRRGDGGPETATAELAHETLIEVWPALRKQVREDERFLAGRAELTHDCDRWSKQGRPPALLPGDIQLAHVHAWLKDREDELAAEERDFLERARQRRRSRRARARAAWTAVAVVFALIVGLGTFLVYQERVSTQREEDSRSRLLATYSAEAAKQDPGQAALIALGAYAVSPTAEARNAVLRRYDQVKNAAWVLTGTEGSIRDVAMSVDGSVTLATTENGRATLFVRQAGGRVQRLQLDLDDMAFHPLVSRDGRRIAHVSASGTLVRYEVDVTATAPQDLLGPPQTLRGAEFVEIFDSMDWAGEEDSLMALSPDAGRLATMVDGRLTLWDLMTGRRQDVPGRLPGMSKSVWFGPDENTLVVSRSGTAVGELVMDAVDVRTGKVRELADDVDDRSSEGSATALSGDGGVLVFCRRVEKGDDEVAVYRALRVKDGRPLNSYTYDTGYNSDCGSIAVDEKGDRFTANHHEMWITVGTRRGSSVTQARAASPDLVIGRLLGDAQHTVLPMVAYGDNHVTAQPLVRSDVVGSDIVLGSPRLVDDGRSLLAHLVDYDKRDKGETLALVDPASGRITTEVKWADRAAQNDQGLERNLEVNDAGTLVADVVDRDRIQIREIPSLRQVAEITTHAPPVDRSGSPEALTFTFLRGGDELVTLSGSRIEHWDARTGRPLSPAIDARALGLTKKNPPRFGEGRPAADGSGFAVNRHVEKGYVQIMVAREPVLYSVHLRTGKENKNLRFRLGPRIERAIRDGSGRYAAAKSPGGMLELWSTPTGERPARLVGPLGPLGSDKRFTGDGFVFDFTGNDGEFFVANGGSVRFQQLSDSDALQTYDFAAHQYFLAASPDGRTLLRTLSGGSFGGGNGERGRLDLLHLDPALWKRHLCAVVGRDLTADERGGLPSGLPEEICPA
ncbi:serine protease [Streptomyces pakalii]|uniref:Serine protease n=1 Tax=Streptomyces pakalii TaxID=3036494 RepID=A0ABT7DFU4_9ACTN|nr:serine protease [Streptomyces pakalii]MDJ1644700.1 serine protease [Streptomyces pakalii]